MKIGYTSQEACKIASISYRQISYWDKTNLAKPSIAGAHGTGTRRIYSFVDLVCLRAAAKLKEEGVSVQKIRKSLAYLSKNFPEQESPLADFVFLTDGDSVFVLTKDPQMVLDTLRAGQYILSLAIGRLVENTKDKILNLERAEEEEGHVFEVAIEPDKDVYLAYCPVLPGCITWGHTEAEAYQYIKETVTLYLEDMIDDGDPIPGIGIVKNIKEVNPMIRVKDCDAGEKKAVV